MGRKIFIDAGAHEGESTRRFVKENKEWEIFVFEPNPNIAPKGDYWYQLAVWIEDGEKDFYLYKEDKTSEGCTLMRKKAPGKLDVEHPIKVKCMDFSRWIMKNFTENDHIVLKMDIEGAEYAVLKKMIKDGSIHYINRLYIEYHYKKIGMKQKYHKKLIRALRRIPNLERCKEYSKG